MFNFVSGLALVERGVTEYQNQPVASRRKRKETMTRYHILPAGIAAILLLNSACTHYYYAPNSLQTPFLQNRHDTRLSFGAVSGDEFSGLEAHAVYSPVKYGAVMVNYFRVHSSKTSDTEADWGKGHLAEMARGAYYPLGKHISFSFFTGLGKGRVLNSYESGTSDMRFRRLFLQPSISFQYKMVRAGLSWRMVRLEYVQGYIDYGIGEPHLGTIARIERNSPLWMPEAGFNFGFGTRPLWLNLFLNFNNSHLSEELSFAPLSTGISICFELDQVLRKKKTR